MGVLPCFYWTRLRGFPFGGFSLVLSWGGHGHGWSTRNPWLAAVARVEKTSGEVTVSILQGIQEGKW